MRQLPDGRWSWERGQTQPLCYECEALTDLYRYTISGAALWFCCSLCASRYAFRLGLVVDHDNRTLSKHYNGAYKGYSPYDMDDRECGCGGDYDCCDDAEDYGEDE